MVEHEESFEVERRMYYLGGMLEDNVKLDRYAGDELIRISIFKEDYGDPGVVCPCCVRRNVDEAFWLLKERNDADEGFRGWYEGLERDGEGWAGEGSQEGESIVQDEEGRISEPGQPHHAPEVLQTQEHLEHRNVQEKQGTELGLAQPEQKQPSSVQRQQDTEEFPDEQQHSSSERERGSPACQTPNTPKSPKADSGNE